MMFKFLGEDICLNPESIINIHVCLQDGITKKLFNPYLKRPQLTPNGLV